MSEPISFWDAVEDIRSRDDRFAPDAYAFLMDVLEHTLRRLDERRHITARELLEGLRDYARERYGVMARTVLEGWGVQTTGHVGDIVFQLVESGVLSRREGDAREDFNDVFDLYDALERDYFGEDRDEV